MHAWHSPRASLAATPSPREGAPDRTAARSSFAPKLSLEGPRGAGRAAAPRARDATRRDAARRDATRRRHRPVPPRRLRCSAAVGKQPRALKGSLPQARGAAERGARRAPCVPPRAPPPRAQSNPEHRRTPRHWLATGSCLDAPMPCCPVRQSTRLREKISALRRIRLPIDGFVSPSYFLVFAPLRVQKRKRRIEKSFWG